MIPPESSTSRISSTEMPAQRLRFHLPAGVIRKATTLDALTNRIIVHATLALLHTSR